MKKVFKFISAIGLVVLAGFFLFSCLTSRKTECTAWIDGEKITYDSPGISFLRKAEFDSAAVDWKEPENYSFKYEIWHGNSGPSTVAAVTVVDGKSSVNYDENNLEGEQCDSISSLLRFFENYYQARITEGDSGQACFYNVVYDSTLKDSSGNLLKVPFKMGETKLAVAESDDGRIYDGDLHIYINNVKIN